MYWNRFNSEVRERFENFFKANSKLDDAENIAKISAESIGTTLVFQSEPLEELEKLNARLMELGF